MDQSVSHSSKQWDKRTEIKRTEKMAAVSGATIESSSSERVPLERVPLEPKMKDHWLSSNLVVKMVDRAYKKGRHYNTKVSRVQLIVGDVVIRGSGSLLLLLSLFCCR